MSKILLTSIACLVFSCFNAGAQDLVKQVGRVKKAITTSQEIKITTENASVIVSVYTPSIVRVRITDKPAGDDFSYAVTTKPETVTCKIDDTPDEIRLQTDSLKAVISKNPFSITFFTPDGRLINEDEKGLNTSWIGNEVTTYKHLQDGERFIGLGEKTGNLDRKGSAYTNWNTDVFGYSVIADPLYSSIPFYMGIHHGLSYGIFLDNTYKTEFNFGASNNRFSSFTAAAGEMNYYFIFNNSVSEIIRSYTHLTGRMHMPPLWSLGYQQNRFSYYPDTDVYRVANTLREKKIPADGITLDIHYMDSYKLFTWDKERFPQPKIMIDSLKKMGLKTTLIVDPGIKVEKNYPAYESGLKENIFVKYSDGQNYMGEVWPGWCHFPDFTSSKGRNWWQNQIKNYTDIGVEGIWNDMNEISTWGNRVPGNILFDYDGHLTTFLQARNVYALNMTHASFDGAKNVMNKRPFLLTRSGYAGLQRYTAIWTGDNNAEDAHMLAGVRLLTSLGLSGVSFSGMDIGGFTGTPSIGLYTRWLQLGTFIPYFRTHTNYNNKASDPWSYGEDVLEMSRKYINLRYRLLPYIYSAFYESAQSGLPVARSLAIDYTYDENIYKPAFQNQFLFGQSLLVLPQESNKDFAKIYLPKGDWYNMYTGMREQGGSTKIIELTQDKLPVYVKESSIIPMQSLVQSTIEKPSDTLTVHVYAGNVNNAFVYYEDDGTTYDYEKGSFYKRTIHLDAANRNIVFEKPEGSMASKFKYIQLCLHGFNGASIKQNGNALITTTTKMSYLSAGKSILDNNGEQVITTVIRNDNDTLSIIY